VVLHLPIKFDEQVKYYTFATKSTKVTLNSYCGRCPVACKQLLEELSAKHPHLEGAELILCQVNPDSMAVRRLEDEAPVEYGMRLAVYTGYHAQLPHSASENVNVKVDIITGKNLSLPRFMPLPRRLLARDLFAVLGQRFKSIVSDMRFMVWHRGKEVKSDSLEELELAPDVSVKLFIPKAKVPKIEEKASIDFRDVTL
jgi:hypothetical protein